jgi:hypothetical protein
MQLQPGARAVQRTARCSYYLSKPAKARRGNAGLLKEILI